MTTLLQLARDRDKIAASGLSLPAVMNIFKASDIEVNIPRCLSEDFSDFINAEYRSCTVTYNCFDKELFSVLDPWEDSLASTSVGCCPKDHGQLPFPGLLLLLYPFNLGDPNEFWLAAYSPLAKITQLIIPAKQIVVFEHHEAQAQLIFDVFLQYYQSSIKNLRTSPRPRSLETVGIMDMVDNLGHQAMNYLSGVQRMLDLDKRDAFEQILISGREFFGPTGELFPEIGDKLKHLPVAEIAELLSEGGYLPYRLGSNIFLGSVKHRILASADRKFSCQRITDRAPLIAITLRNAGRRCINLTEFIAFATAQLLEVWPNLGIILDGWALPESDVITASDVVTAFSSPFMHVIRDECLVALEITQRLPKGLVVGNSVGQSMLTSIVGLRGIHGYIAHVGTLQHKLGFFTSATGIVHGPKHQLSSIESGAFQSEVGRAPIFLPSDAVEDVPTDSTRGPGFSDYRIVNFEAAVELMKTAMQSAAARN